MIIGRYKKCDDNRMLVKLAFAGQWDGGDIDQPTIPLSRRSDPANGVVSALCGL